MFKGHKLRFCQQMARHRACEPQKANNKSQPQRVKIEPYQNHQAQQHKKNAERVPQSGSMHTVEHIMKAE